MKMKRCLAVLMALCLILTGLCGCGRKQAAETGAAPTAGSAQESTSSTRAADDGKITMTGLAWASPQGGDNTDCYGWDEYEKISNVHMEWENVPNDILAERKSTVMASGSLPDIMYGLSFSNSELIRYGSQGLLLPLDEYLENAPNFSSLLEQYPQIRQAITMPDGHIYSLPFLKMGDNVRLMEMYVNQDWLDNLGMDYPETLDEFTEMLITFRDQDANGNGDPSDEIPLSFRKSHLLPTVMSFFGLGNRGSVNQALVDYNEKDNALRFIPSASEYKDMLEYLHMLYEEKLLDNEVFTMSSSRDIVAKLTQDIVGVHADYTTNAGNLQDKFLALPLFTNAYGEKTWNRVLPMVDGIGAFVVSAKTEHPERALQWADYFYSVEGQIMYNMGFEGVTYEYDENGELTYTQELLNNPDGLTLTQARAQYISFQSGPGIMSDEYFKGAETYHTAVEGLPYYIDYIPKDVWSSFNYTYDENEEITALQTDIQSYVDEMTAAFITGTRPLEEWDAYVAEFENLRLDEFMGYVQKGYERYSAD